MGSDAGVKALKKKIRSEVAQTVNSFDAAYVHLCNEAINANVLSLPEYEAAESIFIFVSMPTEVNTHELIRRMLRDGKIVGVPICLKKGIMESRQVLRFPDDLSPGTWGILEPKSTCRPLAPDSFDLLIVPCSSCNRDGRRLGFGGGFYDRYLPKTSAPRAVLCREKQMRDDIPEDEYDQRMDIVISEGGVFRNEG